MACVVFYLYKNIKDVLFVSFITIIFVISVFMLAGNAFEPDTTMWYATNNFIPEYTPRPNNLLVY